MNKWLWPVAAVLLSACSFTGYGGTSKFRCNPGANDPHCESISRTYNNSIYGIERMEISPRDAASVRALMQTPAIESGTPVRSQSEIARIWIAPYLDDDGDLVDQSYTYVTLNQGHWLIAHNQQQIVEEFRPVRLLGSGQQNPEENTSNVVQGSPSSDDRVPDIGLTLDHLGNPSPLQQQ